MRNFWRHPIVVLARKELAQQFHSPATYVTAVVFLAVTGWLFIQPLFSSNVSSLETFLGPLPLLFTFLIPALTMRFFAEELKGGTMETLAALPLRDMEIVLGKFLAALGLLGMCLVPTLGYPAALYIVGRPDIGQIVGGYAAAFGLGMFFSAIGLWASSLTRNQVVSFIIGFFVCFAFFMVGSVASHLPGVWADGVRAVGVEAHFSALARGVLDTRDLLYWASGTLFFLASCLTVIHARRWR